MGMFSGIEEAKASGNKLPFFEKGRYIVKIEEAEQFESQDGDQGVRMISLIQAVLVEGSKQSKGEKTVWLAMNSGKAKKFFLPNCKSLIATALKADTEEIDDEISDHFFGGTDSIALGLYLEVNVVERLKQGKTGDNPDDYYAMAYFERALDVETLQKFGIELDEDEVNLINAAYAE